MSNQTDKVDKLFQAWNTPDSPGYVVGIIKDGELAYVRAHGMANLATSTPLTPESAFNVQSIGKQFTGACIALLVQKGVIALEDDIRKYLPEFPDYGIPIRVRHLVHHTAGIRDYIDLVRLAGIDFRDHFSHTDALKIIMRQKSTNFAPGERHVYGNSGYVLLAEIIERVSGSSFGDFVEAHILLPLGMKNSYMIDRDRPDNIHRVKAYSPKPDGKFEEDPTNFRVKGHGSLVTTLGDLLLWDQNSYDSRIGSIGFLDLISTRGILNSGEEANYAFGIVRGQYKGIENTRHAGEWAGIRADMIRFPNQRFTAVCMANLDTIPATRLNRQIADIYLEDEFRLQEFTGDYFNDELPATHQLVLNGSEMYLRHSDGSEEPINLRADRFNLMSADAHFDRDETNKITGFTCSMDGVQNIHFVKEQAS
jgi:CubicO group peptidase (beta-lactamase class C family)